MACKFCGTATAQEWTLNDNPWVFKFSVWGEVNLSIGSKFLVWCCQSFRMQSLNYTRVNMLLGCFVCILSQWRQPSNSESLCVITHSGTNKIQFNVNVPPIACKTGEKVFRELNNAFLVKGFHAISRWTQIKCDFDVFNEVNYWNLRDMGFY